MKRNNKERFLTSIHGNNIISIIPKHKSMYWGGSKPFARHSALS